MRLLTRADLDGLACALLITRHEPVEEIVLVHPQQITDKEIEVTDRDIIANLPYHPGCHTWFDHHLLTDSNEKPPAEFRGRYRVAPSAAQLVWEHYGEPEGDRTLIEQTNRLDAALLDEADILQPQSYILLGFVLDPRTGLGGEEEVFHHALGLLRESPIEQVLVDEEIRERVIRMYEQNEACCWALVHDSRLAGNVIYTDFRRRHPPPVGNRFLIYTLFPEANVSVRVQWGPEQDRVWITVGHSILNRTCRTSIGELMSRYGGGGHRGAGSAPLDVLLADAKILEILDALREDGESAT